MRPMLLLASGCLSGVLLGPRSAVAEQEESAGTEEVLSVPVGGHELQRILYIAPAHARRAIVMMPGGPGDVGLERSADMRHNENFVIRSRSLWVARGYVVIIPDALDHEDMRGRRSSPEYAAVVDALVDFAHTRVTDGPVFLLGTSQGSIAAMNGAAHARPGQLAGLVLTESVSRLGESRETVFDADPAGVRVPALVVANHDDACNVAPPTDAAKIASSMRNSSGVRVLYVSGGISRSRNACQALTPHGYYGIEQQVVAQIVDWMQSLN
jgi:pimeloyl-ACP methyl ester carboxylesterase